VGNISNDFVRAIFISDLTFIMWDIRNSTLTGGNRREISTRVEDATHIMINAVVLNRERWVTYVY